MAARTVPNNGPVRDPDMSIRIFAAAGRQSLYFWSFNLIGWTIRNRVSKILKKQTTAGEEFHQDLIDGQGEDANGAIFVPAGEFDFYQAQARFKIFSSLIGW